MNEDPIPFHSKSQNGTSASDDTLDDAVEVTLEEPTTKLESGRPTARLEPAATFDAIGELLAMPLQLLPKETREHARNAGREASLALADLGSGLFKGLAIAFNIASEGLKSYSEKRSNVTDFESARARRRKVDIEVE